MINTIISYNKKTDSVPGEETVAVLHFDFSKTFDLLTHVNLMAKVKMLRKKHVGIIWTVRIKEF